MRSIPNIMGTAHSRWWREFPASDYFHKVRETYAIQIAVLGLQMAITVLVSRSLGPSGRGLYAVAGAMGALGVRFSTFGLHASNTYYVAKRPDLLATMVGNTLCYGGVGGCSVILLLLSTFYVFPTLAPLHGGMEVLALLWIPVGLLYLLLQNLLVGAGEVRVYNVLELAAKIGTLVLVITLVCLNVATPEDIFAAGLCMLAADVIIALARLRALSGGAFRCSVSLGREAMTVGFRAYLISFFGFLVLRLDLLMVQRILGPYHSGNYSIASAMADYVMVLPTVFATLLFPKVSAIEDLALRLDATRKASWSAAALLVPLAVAASFLAGPAVRIMFGTAYAPAALAFEWLMPGIVFLGVESVAVQFLNSFRFPASVIAVWCCSTLLNIGLNLWAIPAYGINGAAAVSSITYITTSVFIFILIARTLRTAQVAVAS